MKFNESKIIEECVETEGYITDMRDKASSKKDFRDFGIQCS